MLWLQRVDNALAQASEGPHADPARTKPKLLKLVGHQFVADFARRSTSEKLHG